MALSTNNHSLGRGKIYFNQFAPGTQNLTGERYIGSTSAFGVSSTSDNLDLYPMEDAVVSKAATALLRVERSGSFTTENVDAANLAMFLLGDKSSLTVAGGSITGELHAGVEQGLYYQLGYDAVTNVTGSRNVSSIVVKVGVVTKVLGADYEVDLSLGRIRILDGTINTGDDILVDYTEASYNRDQVVTARDKKLEGALRFISYNASGDQKDYFMPYVQLSPSGEFALKGDEWQKLPFNVSILELNATTEAIYVDGRPYTP